MVHLDLFSGIGGFALAVDEVWPGTKHIFCEVDPFCQALLKKRFEGSVMYGDIRELTANAERVRKLQSQGGKQNKRERISDSSILTGGFPCQPFSQAGKRRGTDDNRFLWPEMRKVIQDFKPTCVIVENVRGLLTIEQGVVFEQVCVDLETSGYEVQTFIIPAVAVNAPHRRDRVWFVANSKGIGERRSTSKEYGLQGRTFQQGEQAGGEIRGEGEGCISNATNPESERLQNRYAGAIRQSAQNEECERQVVGRITTEQFNQNWLEVATRLCRVDDGLPAELHGLKLTKAGHRVERLKALGNAIVPQVAVEIMKAIRGTYNLGPN